MAAGANSAVRFTTYTTLKQLVQGQGRAGQPVSSVMTFGIGAVAGLVTVYTTMPLECVRFTRPWWIQPANIRLCCHGQCDQDAHAEPRGPTSVQELVPLRVPDLHRGGHLALLDGHDAEVGALGGMYLTCTIWASVFLLLDCANAHVREC